MKSFIEITYTFNHVNLNFDQNLSYSGCQARIVQLFTVLKLDGTVGYIKTATLLVLLLYNKNFPTIFKSQLLVRTGIFPSSMSPVTSALWGDIFCK